MFRTLLFSGVLLAAALYAIDQLISCPAMLEDEEGRFAGWQQSKYTGLLDYLKKKIYQKQAKT